MWLFLLHVKKKILIILKKLNNVKFREVQQSEYILLQLADYICTFELLNIKLKEKR